MDNNNENISYNFQSNNTYRIDGDANKESALIRVSSSNTCSPVVVSLGIIFLIS